MVTPKSERVKLASHLTSMYVLSNLIAEYDTDALLKSASDDKHKADRVRYASLLLAFQQEKRAFARVLAKGLMGGAKMLGRGLMSGGHAAANAARAGAKPLAQTAGGLGKAVGGAVSGGAKGLSDLNRYGALGMAYRRGTTSLGNAGIGVNMLGHVNPIAGAGNVARLAGSWIGRGAAAGAKPGLQQAAKGAGRFMTSHPLNAAASGAGALYAGQKAMPHVQATADKAKALGSKVNAGFGQAANGISRGFNTMTGKTPAVSPTKITGRVHNPNDL